MLSQLETAAMSGAEARFSSGARSGMSRRDFLNGCLIASSGLAFGQTALSPAFAVGAGGICGDVVGDDPHFARGGNLPAAFNVGHWLRDRRLTFKRNAVTLAPGCDSDKGEFEIADDGGEFDVVIIGSGLAGLSAAFYLTHRYPGAQILILEANNYAGGNASSDRGAPLPVPASTAGAFATFPYTDWLYQIYKEIGIDWHNYEIDAPGDCYYFDEKTPGVRPGYRGWQIGFTTSLGKLENPPYDQRIMDDLAKCVKVFTEWYERSGGPDDPPDRSNPAFDYLSEMTFADYLTKVLKCDPTVVDFYTSYTIDCMGGTPHYVSAYAVISFLSTEYAGKVFAPPGGTSEIATRLVQWLTKSNPGTGPAHPVDIRLNAVALRVDTDPAASKPSVIYFKDEKFHRANAKAVIVATQASSARHLVAHLLDVERWAAWDQINTVPALMANVAVRSMEPFVELGLGYANHWWGSRHWANFEIADWATDDRNKPDRASVLTFYGAITVPPEEFAAERMRLLQTPFHEYEKSMRDDLARVMRGTNFDFDRDVSAIFVYRWGHSMILPSTKSIFGNVRDPHGRLDRSKAPRRVASRQLGPISFAGQHTEGSPSVESAIGSGYRVAREVTL
jgi:spermidine dehydrogenase